MSTYAPITVRALDNQGHSLFEYAVPFSLEVSARQLLEQAFVLGQSATPDPFLFTLEYYGYSESPQYPGYLGYEVESIAGLSNSAQYYWELLVNGVSSSSGADTTYPNPGAIVTWQYAAIPASPSEQSRRATRVQKRYKNRA
jgi:hypothetical protein